ncbi:OLC1v1032996C1 [Oldenlandia corymbosa var. corymbosa]|uniref:OLC1v1032996C1 n=1 Tax=Oldenlandia corymbosa var. corymbosa TaxID=529605 RepID=A0AAV1CNQ9_OLDCO|nr:OLC1v1032996C1 [Oldenlandia corymbosa var. corymbosa]
MIYISFLLVMSGDDRTSLVLKGIKHGACDYLIKPIRTEELKNIWQHIVRKRCTVSKEHELSGSLEDNDQQKQGNDESEYASCVNEGSDGMLRTLKKRKDSKDEEDTELENDDPSTSKKPRVVWSVELHQQFVTAVNQLGIDKAVPKRILELMNVPGLTRENVASHLQKFRLYLKRLSGVSQTHGGLPGSYCAPLEPNPKMGTLGRFDIQALAASGQVPPQTLAALHAELFNRPTGTVVFPAMDQSALLQASMPVSKGTTIDQNVAYGQPLMKCTSNVLKHFPQNFTSADSVHSGLGTWSAKSPVKISASDNLNGLGGQNGSGMMNVMHQQTQQIRRPHEQQQKQSTIPETSRTINVQPSCLVVPSPSSANFQAGNSLVSANQSRSLSGSSDIDYSLLLHQSHNPPLGTGRSQDTELKHASVIGGLSCDSYSSTSGHLQGQGMPKNTAFFGRATPIPSHLYVDETGTAIANGNQDKMYGEITGNRIKQEPSMNFSENARGGIPMLQRISPNDLMSVFHE